MGRDKQVVQEVDEPSPGQDVRDPIQPALDGA
jgi:hypothetical protein